MENKKKETVINNQKETIKNLRKIINEKVPLDGEHMELLNYWNEKNKRNYRGHIIREKKRKDGSVYSRLPVKDINGLKSLIDRYGLDKSKEIVDYIYKSNYWGSRALPGYISAASETIIRQMKQGGNVCNYNQKQVIEKYDQHSISLEDFAKQSQEQKDKGG
jgi:hypothetical protein